MREPLRVAQIMGKMNRGGVEAVVMNYYRAMDKTKVQFDFFVDSDSEFPQKEELEQAGAGVVMLPPYSRMWAWQKQLTKQLRQGRYAIVHAHINTMNVFPMFCAWRAGVPVRICHNHSTAHRGEGKKTILKYLLRPFNKLFATHWFACGKKAAEWMYGHRAVEQKKVIVLPNAIDTARFAFDEGQRNRLREQLQIEQDTLVLGHVGRFCYQKNHRFLVEIFAELRKMTKAKLLMIGEGELTQQIQDLVREKGLEKDVVFLGGKQNTAPYYDAMDAFCLPSFYEGLPVVAIEAQCSGLPCLLSDQVTEEAILTNRAERFSLENTACQWAHWIVENARIPDQRQEKAALIAQKGFDGAQQARDLQEYYRRLAGKGEER